MLGLFRGHHGQDSHFKAGLREPSVTEIIPSPPAERHNPHEARPKSASSPSAMLSPTLSAANTLQISKRQSTFNRTTSSIRASFGRFTNAFVREQHSIVRRRAEHELGEGMHDHIYNTSYEGLLQWIKSERLMRLPHKGGSWDRVLIAAQYFAEQVHHFHRHIETFTEESGSATNFVFGQCLLLLDLGHENAGALEKAFNLFYQFGLDLSPLLQRADLFHESRAIMEDLGRAFADLLQIVTGISVTFYQAVHSGRPFTKIDIFASFSSIIETFRLRVHRCSREMWDAVLMDHGSDGRQVDLLQQWLAPTDSVLAFLSSNHINVACRPEQFTCTWFQQHLAAFVKGRGDILLVEGKVGSGKTTLANWIVDRLQRPINRKHVSTISFFYDYSIAAQSTPLAMLRTLFNQLLAARIGNIQLFNAANQAYLESRNQNLADQESTMWRAFSKALQAVSSEEEDSLVMVIDGITASDTIAQQACKKLHDLAQKYTRVRLIQLSEPINHKPHASVKVTLSTENMIDDIRTLIRRKLHAHQHFSDRDIGDQESIIERISAAAEGSMLWSYLVCKLLQRQQSCNDFDETLKTVVASSITTLDVIRKLFVSLKLDSDCKSLLSLLIAAERPLHLSEVEALFSVQPEQLTLTSQPVHLQSSLNHLSPLVIVAEGLVAIRHDAIRQALPGLKSDTKFVQQLRHGHQDILIRLFVATKISLSSQHEPTFTRLEISQAESKLRSHPLLEYTVRYWTLHLKKTHFFKPTGDLELPKEFKSIFSESVSLCLLEQACWSAQFFVHEALELHSIAFRVRKALFQQNHACVLQSAILYASICEGITSRHSEAIEWYAVAARISLAIGAQADITLACCNILLRVSETSVTKKRTTIMNYREEVLLILVTSYKVRYGTSSKELLEIYKRLHEFYLYLEEETKITEIVAIIQQLTIVIYGSHSDEAQSISRQAQVLLRHREHAEEIETEPEFIFRGYTEEVEESLTIIRIEEIIREAVLLISRGELERAEEHYIELWLKLGNHCHVVHTCEWHEMKIRVMVIYAEFLLTRKRYTEASAILVAIWTEYEHHEFSMIESIILLFKRVALCMKEVKLLTMALLVYQRCYNFFKHEHREHSVIFKEIETQISVISVEITKTESKTIETSSETVIRTVFETSMTSETITSTSIELCESMVSICRKSSRWSEAATYIERVVSKSWSSFFSESVESITMVELFRSETIKLVLSLAQCYIEMKKLERAEDIYIRLYWAQRSHLKIDSAVVIEYRDKLLHFYRCHEMFTRTICFYQEILVDYRTHCGASHALTIEVLYALGQLCHRYQANYGYWLEYYLEIVTSLNKGAHICHKEAFKALIIIADHYYETLRYSESLVYFKLIFATFCKHGLEYNYFESVTEVKLLIKHYFHSIEESKIEIHEHIRILKELREACYKYYGSSHEITLHVTITLAETCCRSEHFQFEAISFYELIMKHSSSFSQDIITRTEKSLKTLYVKQVTTKTTTITKETLERATTVAYKRYTEVRKEYSCSHEVTLTHLRELVMMYHKQVELKIDVKAMELAIKELKTIIIDCVTKITSAKELIEAATALASIYLTYGLVSKGFDLVKELKLQVIYKWTEHCSHWGFNVISIGRESFAFIAAFEYYLHVEHKISLTLFMSDLVAEHLFYGRLMHYIKIKKHTEMVFMCAARLCQILIRSKRVTMFTIIEQKVLHYFIDVEKAVMKTSSKETVQIMISVILRYLSEHSMWKSWTAAAGYATICHLKVLLREHKHKEALDLTRCVFRFLMQHEGLDDPTEITLGFQLCLMMAGRTDDKALNHKSNDANINQGMMELSRQIIAEVFGICEKFKFNLTKCRLEDLNSLIILIGEQKDYKRLEWLLELLWNSREGQTSWSSEVVLALGKRLVQALFASGDKTKAIRLCENIVYNVRRVHGVRHYRAISFSALLASMYTSLALKYCEEAVHEHTKNKTHARDMARVYFKKAIQVHEEVLKQIVSTDDIDDSDCDDDESDYTDITSVHRGVNGTGSLNGGSATGLIWPSREAELHSIRIHIRRLQLALQRYGGFVKPSSTYEKLTSRVWEAYHKDPAFNMGQEQVLANKWKIEGYGSGKAEGEVSEDEFRVPKVWWILEQ